MIAANNHVESDQCTQISVQPQTSVIIPTYNRASMLKECLNALEQQTIAPLEVIVVNDGSIDDTQRVATSTTLPVRVIEQPNRGKSAALNAALGMSRGDYVWIVDDDDIVLPHALETLTALLKQAPRAGFAYGRHERFIDTADGRRILRGTGYWQDCTPANFLRTALEDFFAHQPGMLARRALLESAGSFDETLTRSQDYEMTLRLALQSQPAMTDTVVFLQRQHDGRRGSATQHFDSRDSEMQWIASDQAIFRNIRAGWPLDAFLASRTIMTAGDERAALLHRGVVMARHKLWREAIDDFEAAITAAGGPLTPDDRRVLRRAFQSKYGIAELHGRSEPRALLVAFASDRRNKAIARAMARGLAWRVREALAKGRATEAAELARLCLVMMR